MSGLRLLILPGRYVVCRLTRLPGAVTPRAGACLFLSVTPDEISWVGPQEDVPSDAQKTESGWRGWRVAGTLDFALTGILAQLTGALAEAQIPVFAVSTHDTDYLFVKEQHWLAACAALAKAGYAIEETA